MGSTLLYTNKPESAMGIPQEDGNMEQRPKKLLDQVRDAIQLKHYSIRTEESYVAWIRRYIPWTNSRSPTRNFEEVSHGPQNDYHHL